jgi:3-isopropylmalate dehydrogenase
MGAILTAGMMLDHLGFQEAAGKIDATVLEAVRHKKTTADFGGSMGTREVGEWIARQVRGH